MGVAFRLLGFTALLIATSLANYDVHLSSSKQRYFFEAFDKSLAPHKVNGAPFQVEVGEHILAVDFDNIKHPDPGKLPTMTMYSYKRLEWTDKRFTNLVKKGGEPLVLDEGAWKYAWIPDIFDRNSMELQIAKEPFDHIMMKVSEGGKIWFSYKAKDVVACKPVRKGQKFFVCEYFYESFKYSAEDVVLTWQPVPVDTSDMRAVYKLHDTRLWDCSQNYTTATYSCLTAKYVFKR